MVIPNNQKAVVFESHGGKLKYLDIPVPKPKSNEILINVKYSGVCHTDLHVWKGHFPLKSKLPLVGGHEGTGEVVEIGKNVQGWDIGDLAGIKWINSTCMSCEFCQNSNESNCINTSMSGYTIDGSFQQYATADATQAAKIPKGTNLAEVSPILCAGITVYKALKTSGAKPGQWVAVSGAAGGLGSMTIQYARAMGFRVLAIDGGNKVDFVESLGAEKYIDFSKSDDIVKEIQKFTDGGPHVVINTSTSPRAMSQSTEYVRACGTVVLVGLPNEKMETSIFDTVVRCISIKGSCVGNRADSSEAIDFFSRGLVKCPIKVVGLSELATVYDLIEQSKIMGRYVIDTSK